MRTAIIPARGGSKRIPGKNIREFCGAPMIAWPIAAAQASGCFDEIVVSTDSDEIAAVARNANAETPFVRPAELSDDHATTLDVIAHAVQWLRERDRGPRQVACIYATAPFLTADDIREGLALLEQPDTAYAVTVTPFAFPIQRAVRLDTDQRLEMVYPEHALTRSQDLEEHYHDAGALYWGTADAFAERRPFFAPHTKAIRLPRYRVHDIDTEEDWRQAELMFQALGLDRHPPAVSAG